MGAQVDIIGMVGKDGNGNKLRDMLKEIGANVDGILFSSSRPTIIKTRVIALKDAVDDGQKTEALKGLFNENNKENHVKAIDFFYNLGRFYATRRHRYLVRNGDDYV